MNGPLLTSFRVRRLRGTRVHEYAMRFVFGGLVTVGAGLISTRWGPVVGGLFLAFPSILPASLTLVAKHTRLTSAAGADALGAVLGSLGMLGFAVVVWAMADSLPAWLLLALALLVWMLLAAAAWSLFQLWHLRRHTSSEFRITRHA